MSDGDASLGTTTTTRPQRATIQARSAVTSEDTHTQSSSNHDDNNYQRIQQEKYEQQQHEQDQQDQVQEQDRHEITIGTGDKRKQTIAEMSVRNFRVVADGRGRQRTTPHSRSSPGSVEKERTSVTETSLGETEGAIVAALEQST